MKKTLVKAAGLKSAFVSNNTVYLTSFGNGNSANLEAKISSNVSEEINRTNNFSLGEITPYGYEITNGRVGNVKSYRQSNKYDRQR